MVLAELARFVALIGPSGLRLTSTVVKPVRIGNSLVMKPARRTLPIRLGVVSVNIMPQIVVVWSLWNKM